MSNYEIVCIDDEVELLELYELALNDLDYKVVTFDNPLNGLDYLKENHTKIIAVISDYKMPDLNGLEFKEKVNDADIQTPFFMVTGFYNKEMAVQGMELKVSKFIQKPFDSDSLVSCIKQECEKYVTYLEEEYEMIRSFVDESFPMLEEIEELILILEDEPQNVNALNTYFRLLHTIKGTASCVGLKSLPDFAHKYEDLVGSLKDGNLAVSDQIINVFLKGLDVLKRMYSDISSGKTVEFDISKDLEIFNKSNYESEEVTEKKKDEKVVENAVTTKKAEDQKLSVQISLLDEFMELSGELTVLRNMIFKSVGKIENRYTGDKDVDVLSDALEEMHKVSSKLQNEIAEMRKVSLDSIYRPLKRIVRDASKSLKKSVDIEFSGDDLRVDTSVGRVLSNVLVHLIRNGVDHGIETPAARKEKGKEEKGTIQVTTTIDPENIYVEILDDGNGINKNKLKEKALEKNLYSAEELEMMSDQKIFGMIFESGFSTAKEVTDISGRGVGMDMVKSSVEDLNGKIYIDSEEGRGSKFYLVIPIPRSVLIIKSLMVDSEGQQYAVPLQDVGEVLNLDDGKVKTMIRKVDGKHVLNYHEELIPLIHLGYEFKTSDRLELEHHTIVVIRGDGFNYGIIVDQVFDIEEVVCKDMVKQLQKDASPFQGATLIGDGEVALILDLENIAKNCNISILDVENEDIFSKKVNDVEVLDEYLQFDLFTEGEYCINLDSVDRLEEFHAGDISFTGNIPVIRYRNNFVPIIDMDFCLGLKDDVSFNISGDILNIIVVDVEGKKFGCLVKEINDIAVANEEVDTLIRDRDAIEGTVYLNGKTVSVIDILQICREYKELYSRPIQQVTQRIQIEEKLAA